MEMDRIENADVIDFSGSLGENVEDFEILEVGGMYELMENEKNLNEDFQTLTEQELSDMYKDERKESKERKRKDGTERDLKSVPREEVAGTLQRVYTEEYKQRKNGLGTDVLAIDLISALREESGGTWQRVDKEMYLTNLKYEDICHNKENDTSNLTLEELVLKYNERISYESTSIVGMRLTMDEYEKYIDKTRVNKRLYLCPGTATNNWIGIGLATDEKIENGAFIIEYGGLRINCKDWGKTETQFIEDIECSEYLMKIDNGYFIEASDVALSGCGRFANHSCDPNAEVAKMYLSNERLPEKTVVYLKALRDIQADEEITICYGLSNSCKICKCGAVECSGKVGVSVAKMKELRRKKERREMRNKLIC